MRGRGERGQPSSIYLTRRSSGEEALEVAAEVHAGVEGGDLIAIAIEHEGGALEEFAEAALAFLAPAGMIDIGIDVGIEAVLMGIGEIPGGVGLVFDEFDFDDGFDALEAIFPGEDHTNGSAILIGESGAKHADGKEGERVHGFVEAEALDVGQLDAGHGPLGHLAGVVITFEGDEFGFRGGFGELGDDAEGIADPGNDDGPGLYAAVAIDALFERGELEDFVHGIFAGMLDFAFDGNAPGRSAEIAGVAGGIFLACAELVEIIVVGDVIIRGDFFGGAVRGFDEVIELYGGGTGGCAGHDIEELAPADDRGSGRGESEKEIAAMERERTLFCVLGSAENRILIICHLIFSQSPPRGWCQTATA